MLVFWEPNPPLSGECRILLRGLQLVMTISLLLSDEGGLIMCFLLGQDLLLLLI